MLEIISILFVCWLIWSFVKGFMRANSMNQSREFGIEARHIAVNELGVPEDFYNKKILNNIDEVKKLAISLAESGKPFSEYSWPRKLAHAIHFSYQFHADLENKLRKSREKTLIEPWMRSLWQWTDDYNMSRIFSRDPVELTKTKKVHFTVYEYKDVDLVNETRKFPNFLPKEIGKLSNLEIFVAGDVSMAEFYITRFEKLPAEIGNLTKLKYLYLQYNNLTCLPKEIAKLKQLKQLKLGGNNLEYLPSEIGDLENLELLTVWQNNLLELPPEIGRLKNLKGLSFWGNKITKLPDEITNLKNLKELDFLTYGQDEDIILTADQNKWIENLKSNGCNVY